MRDIEKQPSCKVVARRKGYVLYENGELWATDERGWVTGEAILYRAGCRFEVENDEIINGFEVMDCAIEDITEIQALNSLRRFYMDDEEHEASPLDNI